MLEPTNQLDQEQSDPSRILKAEIRKIMDKCCTRRSFLSSATLVVGAGLLAGGWIRTNKAYGKGMPYVEGGAAGATKKASDCISIADQVPNPERIEFQVQYPGMNPITLRGHYWYNQNAAAQGGKFPAIVEFNPYRSFDGTFMDDSSFYPWFAYNEYLCFRVDLQGSGNSEGVLTNEYTDEELLYCTQVISQIAGHPLCDGNVGMMGWSWSAINSLMVAARDDCPAALKAILVVGGTDDRYNDDVHYSDGAMVKDNVTWSANLWEWLSRPPDPLVVGDGWKAMWGERVRNANFFFKFWGEHQTRDSYWSDTSVRDHYERVKVPVNIVSGYQDISYCTPVPRVVAGLASQGKQVQGLIGPWGHNSPNVGCPGPRINWLPHLEKHWWDKWLKGVEPPPEKEWPQLAVWLGESKEPETSPKFIEKGKWVAEDADWETRKEDKLFYLSENAKLSPTEPQGAASVASSQQLVLTTNMPEIESWGDCSIADLPGDQAEADRQSVVFDSDPLAEDLDCFGYPTVKLNLSCDKPLTCLAVRLCEVPPDSEKSHLVCYRFFNLCYRDDDQAHPRLVQPGEVFEVSIPLNVLGHTFKKGWKIRLSLSTSFFPTMWQTPEISIATVYTGPMENFSASALSLPLRRPRAEDSRMAALFPPDPKIECVDTEDYISVVREWRTSDFRYEVKRINSGRKKGVMVNYIMDTGKYKYGGHLKNLCVNKSARHTIQIFDDDPLSLNAFTSSTLFLERKTGKQLWKVKSQTSTQVWTEKDTNGAYVFRYNAVIKTYIANRIGIYKLFETRTDQGSIPRNWV